MTRLRPPRTTTHLPGLTNNQLSGPIPASFKFNNSFAVIALSLGGNNMSGPIPEWPDEPGALLEIRPGNPLLCGKVRCSCLPSRCCSLVLVRARLQQLAACHP